MFSGVAPLRSGLARFRSALRTASIVAGAVLVAFHGWLFAGQIADGRLSDPWLVFRWMAAAGLIAALVSVRRGGESVWGRKGIVIWVLAALLHGPAVAANSSEAFNALALPKAVATSVLQVIAATVLGPGLWLLASLLARRRQPTLVCDLPLAFAAAGILANGFSPPYSSRPPPQIS